MAAAALSLTFYTSLPGNMSMAYLVGITGGTGSGKGTLAELIQEHLTRWDVSCFILSTDDCYKDLSYLPADERDKLCFDPEKNFDNPESLNEERLVAYGRFLKKGKPFNFRKYDFSTHSYENSQEISVPEGIEVAVVEGIFSLHPKELLSMYDYKIFVDTHGILAALRRVRRDANERGRDVNHIIDQMTKTVVYMQEQFVFTTKMKANEVVDWRVDETKEPDEIQKRLIRIARQRALAIYEAVKGPLLPEIDSVDLKFPNPE